MAQKMLAKNAVSAKLAECYITIDGQRYNFMNAINFSAKYEKTKKEVPILGRMSKGNKTTGGKLTGSAEFHLNNSIFAQYIYQLQQTGEDLNFTMQVTNNDPTTDVGKQTMIFYGCNLDSVDLAKFDADSDDFNTSSIDFTIDRFVIKEAYATMDGMM